jgi:hypothetical protein
MPVRVPAKLARSPLPYVLLLWAVRGALVLALGDVFFHGEELEKGTVAKAMLDGLPIEHHRLAYHYYEGGGFVISHAKALAFLLVGENVLAHKLVALVTCTLVLLAGWNLVRRHFGLRAARIFALAYVFAPPSWQKLGLLSLGIHYEACFLVLVLLDLLLRWTSEARAPTRSEALTFGLAGGFGLYFSYQLVLPLVFSLSVILVRRPRQLVSTQAFLAILALLAGALPLWLTWAKVGAAIVDVHGARETSFLAHMGNLGAFAASLYAPPTVGAVAYPLVFVFACVVLLRIAPREERSKAAVLALFLCFWGLVYVQSDFVVGRVISHFSLMRFAPPWIVAWVLIAAGIARSLESARAALRGAARLVLGLLVPTGALGTLSILHAGSPFTPLANLRLLVATKGYDYAGWFAKVWDHLEGDDAARLSALSAFDEPDPGLLWADLAGVAWQHGTDHARMLETLRGIAGEHYEDALAGLPGYAADEGAERFGSRDLASALRAASELGPPLDRALPRALGRSSLLWAVTPLAIADEARTALALTAPAPYFEGLGERIWHWLVLTPYGGGGYAMHPERALAYLDTLPAETRASLRAGFDRARAMSRRR